MVAWARVGKQWRRENLMRVWMCSQVESCLLYTSDAADDTCVV